MATHLDPDSPWYRPPPNVSNGTPRLRGRINADLLVSNEEGRRWFKQKYGIELADHHRQDMKMEWLWAVLTQYLSGCWRNDGPDNYEKVLMEDMKPMETAHEGRIKEWLEKELGIKTSGFKAYFE